MNTKSNKWILISEKLPPYETPVLILNNGKIMIGEIQWEYPTYEETFEAYSYWDDPNNPGKDWYSIEITHWMPLPEPPSNIEGE